MRLEDTFCGRVAVLKWFAGPWRYPCQEFESS